ncbi:hypothetical protein ACFSTH_07530 [Paenibacillus yanchengensis]|uniref:DUF3196 domain-containing protein n=1 Tax=Paenibacillus yanchengensis TaxID=2035833 RepID=A0ABW4YLW1_9BACL
MLDQYQLQLTRLLETERYAEAKQLIRFLLQCKGLEETHYEEWNNLLDWLEMAFPSATYSDSPCNEENYKLEVHTRSEEIDEQTAKYLEQFGAELDDSEGELREKLIRSMQLDPVDENFANQIVYIIKNHPVLEQQLLALERAAYLDVPHIEQHLVEWLEQEKVHPVLQFKTLQCLKRRKHDQVITMERMNEKVQLSVMDTPLQFEEFPPSVQTILQQTQEQVEVQDVTLPYFAKELWRECVEFLYGTSYYNRFIIEPLAIPCLAAALHEILCLTVYGEANETEIRERYHIDDSLRFGYEQAARLLRQVTILLQDDE